MTTDVQPTPQQPTARQPTDLFLRESEEIQGDILAGFKKDQMVLLFLRFEDGTQARTWLRRLTPRIATTRQVAAFNKAYSEARKQSGGDPQGLKATWLNVSFSYQGLAALTGKDPYPDQPANTTLGAFKQGPAVRHELLGDIGDSNPDKWYFGNHTERQAVHAVLTIASDSVAELASAVAEQRESASEFRITVLFQQDCATLKGSRRGKEHFGFKDGVSEPGVHGFDEEDPKRAGWVKDHPGTRLIKFGEFIAGYPDQQVTRAGFTPPGPIVLPAWATNGSFQVVRRLGQDVPGWWAQVGAQLQVLKKAKAVDENTTVEWLASRMVGRWRSGTPVAKCPEADRPFNTVAANDNDISFRDDPDGTLTPLFSHLRKTNPRDGLRESRTAEPFDEDPIMDRRRIIRRGSPYGHPFDPTVEGPGGADEKRGLLFVSYQVDLISQFEFIQQSWIDAPDFPPNRGDANGNGRTGPDGMVGLDGTLTWERADGKEPVPLGFHRFVQTEGSVYAFVPSLSTLRSLSEGKLPDTERVEPGRPVDTFLPIPDLQRRNGKSLYYAFRTLGAAQQYRIISIADGSRHADALEKPDQPLSAWKSLNGVTNIDLFLPYPDMQRKDGKSWFWVFHSVNGQQQYRVVSLAEGNQADVMERGDGPLTRWQSLNGVAKLDFVIPVPDRNP